ncbi:hypothetical protein QR680_009738 [Steinernema hermaphroditum]|uniref:Doublecortin domain-containing protein n=1 Tax=Steinernema hermaphroditum TaxID=289476 RepID=A0AA39IMV4_9BILA|nr:hypothetical protein QR680_009738 [Steinernema hermaphroditum]
MASTPHSEEPSTSQSSATTSREAMSGEGGDEGDGRSEQRLQRNQSIFPNLPTPVNGRIKTYGTAHRSFSRPYSAKTVFFYKEGDEHFAGVRVPVSKSRYRNIDALLDDLNTNIQMPFGVRRLMTPGRTPIVHIDQLEHLGKYVVSSSRFGKGVDFEALEKIHKARELAQKNFRGNEGFWNPTSPNFKAKLRMGRSLGLSFLPLTAKQMFFVLNGNRTRIYRALLNPLKAIDFDALLEEVSEGLQTAIFKLYAYDGTRITNVEQLFAMKEARVLAVPRNERPIFKSADSEELMGNGVAQKSYLPPISKTQFYASNTASTSKTQITNPSGPRRQIKPSNSIERAPASTARSKPTMGLTRGATNGILPSRIPRVDDPTTSKKKAVAKPRLKRTGTAPPPVIVEKQQANQRLPPISRSSVSNTADDSDSGRPRSTEYDWKEEDEEETAEALKRPPTTYEEDYDDDPERPRSKASILEDRIEAGGGGRLSGMEEKTDEEEEEEDRGREDGEEEAGRTEEDISLRSRGEAPETPSRVEESEEEKVKGGDREEEELEEGDYQEDPPLQEDYTSGGTHYVDPQERAAVKIQAWARGNFARKTLNLERDDDRYDEEDDEHIHDQHEAALVIQSHYRGYRTRRELKDGTYKFVNEGRLVPKEEIPMEEEVMGQEELRETLEQLEQLQHIPEEDEHQHEEEPEPTEDKRDEIDEDLRPEEEFPITVDVPPETAHNPRPPETDGNTYSVVVHTGDRTGAGTEADLYIILHGEGGKSEKMPLKQETEAAPKFRENSVDFFLLHCRFLGTLTKIVVGHEIHGYGAGVFIDYVTVNENVHDGRQYLFNCYKWFDSGMVDGKIERTLKMTAYSYVASIPEDYRITRGNWELILHSGDKHGNGATTSRLNIIGYGTEGKSEKLNIYEENLSKVPSTSLVQVDFGKIGELTKVRIEIEGHGNQPDYYLNFVELKDLDTEERLVVNCGKWLRWNKGDEKHAQSFRDLVIFRAGEKKAPLPVFTYEGKLRIMTSSIKSCDEEVRIELISKNDETGIFPVVLENRDGDSYDVSFKVDAVDIGDVLCAQIYFSPTLIGEEIYEGISCVHEILHKHDAMPDAVNSYWIVSYLTVRKSNHFPQRRVLKRSRCRPLAERNASYVKQLYYVKTEEMTTRISKKKKAIQGPKESHWMLSMKLREDSTVLPEVILCSRETEVKMDVISREMVDGVVNYEKKGNIGTITKIRVGMDSFSYVKGKEKATPEVSFILKMRLVDSANGDELPFPDPYVALQPHNSICVIEFPATWPDSEPPKGIVYEAKLIGERGLHSGFRKLEEPGVDDLFAEDTERMLRLQALHLGELKAIEIDVEASKSGEPFEWECAEIRVVNTGNLHYYEFDCGTTFTNENRQQLFSVAPIPIAHSV